MYEKIPLPAFHQDLDNPVLFNKSTKAVSTAEQDSVLQNILELSSSDSNFAARAYKAIKVLQGGGANEGVIPIITSLIPNTKVMGSQTFFFRVKGTGFDNTCVIYVNGNPQATAFVNATEVTTNLTLVGVTSPATYSVVVITGLHVVSNSVPFTVTSV